MKKILVVLALAGCASVAPQTPSQAIFAAKESYAAALVVAVTYKNLPPCPTVTKVCSDPKVVSQLQKTSDAADALLDGAEATVRAGGSNVEMAVAAAQQAVQALTSITNMLKVR